MTGLARVTDRAPLVAALLGLVMQSLAPCGAQPNSGLEGRELRSANELDVQEVIGAVLGATSTGKLEGARVTEDRELRLVVEVRYQDLPNRRLEGELRDGDGKAQTMLGRPSSTLVEPSGTALLVFEPRPGTPEGTEIRSASLRLRVLRPETGLPELQRSFEIEKVWRVPIAPENVVVRITPRPEGAAALLREKEAVPLLPPVRVPTVDPRRRVLSGPAATQGTTRSTRPAISSGRTGTSTAAAAGSAVGPVSSSRRATVAAETVLQKLPPSLRLRPVAQFQFGLGKGVTDKQGKGPGAGTFDLLEGLRSDVPLARQAISRISTRIFQDQNAASGIFYFLPESYALAWNPEGGYGLRMLYGAAREGEAAEVLMAARLDAGIETSEVELATKLLAEYRARHAAVQFSELRPLPLEQPPAVSFGVDLQQRYEIPPERIAISALSDALGEVEVSWSTDTVTKENIQLALVEEVGLDGAMVYTPAGGGLPPQSVALRMRLADPETFGRQSWRRGEAWRNATPYPVRLNYLHALLFQEHVPVVLSWNLDGASIPSGARAEFDAQTVPSWIDRRAARMWLDYAPAADCAPCDAEVVAAITGGVTSIGASAVTIRTITPLADLGAYEISITLRSRYFDPRSRDEQTKSPVALNADNADFTVGPIFVVDRQPGDSIPGDPLYSYRLDLALPDGTTRRGTRWIPADSLRLLIGRVQVEQALQEGEP